MSSPRWRVTREAMLLEPGVINLNSGSFGPLPRVVFERVTQLRHCLAAEPMDFLLRQTPPLLWDARQRLATLVGADPHRLVFTTNVTAAINMVAASLRLASPGEILLSDHEYGAMHWCWERAAQRQGLTLKTFPLPSCPSSGEDIVSAACEAMNPRTRLLIFSHVLSPTGMVLPARRLCEEARLRRILTVVDGAHAPAFVPLHLDQIDADFYGANCHKWLLAPTGAGFLYCRADRMDQLQPLQVSWGWRVDRKHLDQRDEFGMTPRLRHLEFEGTRDPSPWLTIPTAIDFQAAIGWEDIETRSRELVRLARQSISLPPVTPVSPELCGAMTAFRLPREVNPTRLRQVLWEKHRMEIALVERPSALLLRVSTPFYILEDEVIHFAEVLPEVLQSL